MIKHRNITGVWGDSFDTRNPTWVLFTYALGPMCSWSSWNVIMKIFYGYLPLLWAWIWLYFRKTFFLDFWILDRIIGIASKRRWRVQGSLLPKLERSPIPNTWKNRENEKPFWTCIWHSVSNLNISMSYWQSTGGVGGGAFGATKPHMGFYSQEDRLTHAFGQCDTKSSWNGRHIVVLHLH